MEDYSEEFRKAKQRVCMLKRQLGDAQYELQKLCPHVYLSGISAYPRAIGFTDCELCGLSSYYGGVPPEKQ